MVNTALGERLRNSAYRDHAGVSALTASRDLKLLADSGLLIAEGAKRGRSYLLLKIAARHPKIVREAAGLKPASTTAAKH